MKLGLKPLPVFLLVVVWLLGGWLAWRLSVSSTPKTQAVSDQIDHNTDGVLNVEDLMSLINQWRTDNNLPKFVESPVLCNVAGVRLRDLRSDFSHNGFSAERFNIKPGMTIGENIQTVIPGGSEVFHLNRWLNSPTHKEILLDNYTHSCIATDGDYAVQIFGYY